MVWLRRTTHYLFIVVVAVNSTLLTINAGDYIFYSDWAWTSFVVFSISQSTMLVVGAIYYMLFTGVPGTDYVLCDNHDNLHLGGKRCMVRVGISLRLRCNTSLDTFGNALGSHVLGHKKK